MNHFIRLPILPLVPPSDTERLREKFKDSRSAAQREAYWMAVQAMKQPRTVDFERLPV